MSYLSPLVSRIMSESVGPLYDVTVSESVGPLYCTEYRPVSDHRTVDRYSLPTPWAVSFPTVLVGLARTALFLS